MKRCVTECQRIFNTVIPRDPPQNAALVLSLIYHFRSIITFSCSLNMCRNNVKAFSVSLKIQLLESTRCVNRGRRIPKSQASLQLRKASLGRKSVSANHWFLFLNECLLCYERWRLLQSLLIWEVSRQLLWSLSLAELCHALFWQVNRPFCGSRLVLSLEGKKNTYGSPPPWMFS